LLFLKVMGREMPLQVIQNDDSDNGERPVGDIPLSPFKNPSEGGSGPQFLLWENSVEVLFILLRGGVSCGKACGGL
jgi:hypothetical protein